MLCCCVGVLENVGNDLRNRMIAAWRVWDKCRRCYKWFSIIQLLIAYLILQVSLLFFDVGASIVSTGDCCVLFGKSLGSAMLYGVQERPVEKNTPPPQNGGGAICIGYLLFFGGSGFLMVSIVLYFVCWIFLSLSFIFAYEEIDYTVPFQYFLLPKRQGCILGGGIVTKNMYKQMDRKSDKMGSIQSNEYVYGQYVYTGWIRVHDSQWIYCHNRRGKMMFLSFESESAIVEYLNSAEGGGGGELFVLSDEEHQHSPHPSAAASAKTTIAAVIAAEAKAAAAAAAMTIPHIIQQQPSSSPPPPPPSDVIEATINNNANANANSNDNNTAANNVSTGKKEDLEEGNTTTTNSNPPVVTEAIAAVNAQARRSSKGTTSSTSSRDSSGRNRSASLSLSLSGSNHKKVCPIIDDSDILIGLSQV